LEFLEDRLTKIEIKVLKDIEDQTNLKFQILEEINWKSKMAISIKDRHIVEMGLNNCKLKTLPIILKHIKYLNKLDLRNNNLITIPKEIGQIQFDIENNLLSRLPENIGELKNLMNLELS
jgi:Leucine-rich repeat (LRR) protein